MDKLERYIEEYSAAEEALLTELDHATNLRVVQPKMVSGRVQGAFLKLVTQMLKPRFVLEMGTFTGYSALSIASGLGEGESSDADEQKVAGEKDKEESAGFGGARATVLRAQQPQLHTIEIDDELEDFARSFFARSPHGHKIHLHIGSALKVVPELTERLRQATDGGFTGFDMVFIDGDKREYPDYYKMLMGDDTEDCSADASKTVDVGADVRKKDLPMLHSGSIILADNVLWYGKVTEPGEIKAGDRMSQGILEFNRLVAGDHRVENVILPLRDGINMIRVK